MCFAILIRPYRNKVSSPKARNMRKYFDLLLKYFAASASLRLKKIKFARFYLLSPSKKTGENQ